MRSFFRTCLYVGVAPFIREFQVFFWYDEINNTYNRYLTVKKRRNRQKPPSPAVFFAISRWIGHFRIFLKFLVRYLKYYKCQMQKCWGNFFEQKIRLLK